MERTGTITPAERETLLKIAQGRNAAIPNIIEEDRVLQERREFRTGVLRLFSHYWLRQGSVLTGQENLDKAMSHAQDGSPLIVVSNHLSDADHVIKRFMLEKNGYKEFADLMLFLGGLKMIERWEIRQVASAERMALIPTPKDIDLVRRALHFGQFSEQELEMLRQLKTNYVNLSNIAKTQVLESIHKNNHILGFYPEGGRSYSGFVDQQHINILSNTWYDSLPDGYIVPISVEGGEHIVPPNELPKLHRSINAVISVDEPIPIAQVLEKASTISGKRNREQFIADYPFSKVVKMLSLKYVDPNIKSYYQKLAAA